MSIDNLQPPGPGQLQRWARVPVFRSIIPKWQQLTKPQSKADVLSLLRLFFKKNAWRQLGIFFPSPTGPACLGAWSSQNNPGAPDAQERWADGRPVPPGRIPESNTAPCHREASQGRASTTQPPVHGTCLPASQSDQNNSRPCSGKHGSGGHQAHLSAQHGTLDMVFICLLWASDHTSLGQRLQPL